jgi:N-acetylglutamate synthase-like GNAT family acetyltransferase
VLAEIRSLGVDPDCRGHSVGSTLVQYFIRSAAALHIPRVFVLTRAPTFFARLGFREERMNTLPEKVWKDCVDCPKRDCCDEIPMIYEINT